MNVILDICGWLREEEIPMWQFRAGIVEIRIDPPMECLVRKKDSIVGPDKSIRVRLVRVGELKGKPWFRYEL